MKKLLSVLILFTILFTMTGCDATASRIDNQKTQEIGDKLAENQPTPTDIEYSLERYNLIRRAYWVNGQREKALTLPSPVALPLGYVVLLTSNSVVAQFTVEGKVSSLQNYLTPISEYFEGSGDGWRNDWLVDTDGTYGDNPAGIFFFTVDGKYVEWNGTYMYSDLPIFVEDPVIKVTN